MRINIAKIRSYPAISQLSSSFCETSSGHIGLEAVLNEWSSVELETFSHINIYAILIDMYNSWHLQPWLSIAHKLMFIWFFCPSPRKFSGCVGRGMTQWRHLRSDRGLCYGALGCRTTRSFMDCFYICIYYVEFIQCFYFITTSTIPHHINYILLTILH